ncbi:hypothetical protein FPV67DRAFT_1474543 [Lyophyllum atratum]|nr:hypothetical protein FPV67DRAFT_1474543 [Lyophyllum atratum]
MSAAMTTLMNQWVIPRMNAHTIKASTLEGNFASIRVLQKVGFVLCVEVRDHEEVRGELRGVQWLEWNRNGDAQEP